MDLLSTENFDSLEKVNLSLSMPHYEQTRFVPLLLNLFHKVCSAKFLAVNLDIIEVAQKRSREQVHDDTMAKKVAKLKAAKKQPETVALEKRMRRHVQDISPLIFTFSQMFVQLNFLLRQEGLHLLYYYIPAWDERITGIVVAQHWHSFWKLGLGLCEQPSSEDDDRFVPVDDPVELVWDSNGIGHKLRAYLLPLLLRLNPQNDFVELGCSSSTGAGGIRFTIGGCGDGRGGDCRLICAGMIFPSENSSSAWFGKFVEHALSHRDNFAEVSAVKLKFRGSTTRFFVEDIVNYAYLHNLSWKSCTPNSAWDFPALETLNLTCMRLGDGSEKNLNLFSKCVNLKDITLHKCSMKGLEVFNVCVPHLSSFTITENTVLPKVFNVVAPQLETLTASASVSICSEGLAACSNFLHLSTAGFNALEKVNISLSNSRLKKERHVPSLLELFRVLRTVKFLILDVDVIEVPQKRSLQQVHIDTVTKKVARLEAEEMQPGTMIGEKRMLEAKVHRQDQVLAQQKAKIHVQDEVIAQQKAKIQAPFQVDEHQMKAKIPGQFQVNGQQMAKLRMQNQVIAQQKAKIQMQDQVIRKTEGKNTKA
ncbi:hypothetical protein L1987_03174 [Smallanthus sonchifolius]|uniref:Uncharacterized protein n=1 Tax=Smallanthus sonchifolius TaxID=185202 RepID=A0ACB9KA21_9ASTR|nr:hypothetical protein L1987_03174 [Smallanthus sonchifolius]